MRSAARKRAAVVWWLLGAAAAFSQAAMPTPQARGPVWRQFEFQHGERFSYDLSVYQGPRGGVIPAEIELAGHDSGEWAAWIRSGRPGAEQEVTVSFPRHQPQPLLGGGWAKSGDQKVFLATVLLRLPELEGRELTPGSRWTVPDRDGPRTGLVLGGCTEASIRGVAVELSGGSARGPIQVVVCVAPEVPLALSVTARSKQQNVTMGARLRSYQPAMQAQTLPQQPPSAGSATDHGLNGLYLGAKGKDGIEVASYVFRPSGRVVVSAQTFLDPDTIGRTGSPASGPAAWRLTDRYPIVDLLSPNRQIQLDFGCHFGTYLLAEGSIRLRTRRVQVDVTRRTVYLEPSLAAGPDEQQETLRFRRLKETEVIEIDGTALVRQGDFTGRTLEAAKVESVVFNPAGESQLIKGWFRPDGTFALKHVLSHSLTTTMAINQFGPLVLPGAFESEHQGTYEIRGHEIWFRSPDGKVERKLFGYLGKGADGKERVVIGDLVCPVDRFR